MHLRLRLQWVLILALALLLSPALYSYAATVLEPSSLPVGVRSVEWLRAHDGNWLVDSAEHYWYSWHAPKPGGAQLKRLPAAGLAPKRIPARSADRATAHEKGWPPPIKSVFPHPLAGEGVWRPTGPPVQGKPPVLTTTFRADRAYPRVVAYLAWFDHTRTAVAYYPGRYEPPSATLRGPTMVPYSQRPRLLATFNSGFIYSDGQNGSSLDGHTNEPLKDGLGTLIGYRSGRVDIKAWTGGPTPGHGIAFARQSLPLVIDKGRLNPALDNSTRWGFSLGNAVSVWRTAIGIDRRGNLIYAAADFQTVRSLARILQRAGAVRAIQLDINPEWPTLITYGHHNGLHLHKIVPNPMQPATRYLVPDDRDFFAVYKRLPGPVTVPLH
jgi:hypothetical protein